MAEAETEHRIPSLLQIKLGWKTNGLSNSLTVSLKDRQSEGNVKLAESLSLPSTSTTNLEGQGGEIPSSQDLG